MSIHYKFKNSLQHDVIIFDGLHISVGDLKQSIFKQNKIAKTCNFDLQITNVETNETYQHENHLIPKNSSVIIARIPIFNAKKTRTDRFRRTPETESTPTPSPIDANTTEEDRIDAMISQSSFYYHSSTFVRTRDTSGPVPPNFVCYKCRRVGHHWNKDCTRVTRVKHSSGIPRSFMVAVEGPEVPGALLTSTGQYAVPLIDRSVYCKEKKGIKTEVVVPEKEAEIVQDDFLCKICGDILKDAVVTPCCANSYCDECIRQVLLGSEGHVCPTCGESSISPDTLVPNRFLRQQVLKRKGTRLKVAGQRISTVVARSRCHPYSR